MSLEMKVDTGISAGNLQTTLQSLVTSKYQIIQVVYDTGTSSYTIISQKNNIS